MDVGLVLGMLVNMPHLNRGVAFSFQVFRLGEASHAIDFRDINLLYLVYNESFPIKRYSIPCRVELVFTPLCNFLWIGRFGDTKTQPSPEIFVSAIGMCYKASSVFIDVAKQWACCRFYFS